MDKTEIRKEILKKRSELSVSQWREKSSLIQQQILKSNILDLADDILIYSDFRGEVETKALIEDALLEGKNVYLPRVLKSAAEPLMEFYRIESNTALSEGYMGIREPVAGIEHQFIYEVCKSNRIVMFVPGVAFDKNNNRLGYGKGFYDYYLKDKQNIITIGLCFKLQIVDALPVSDNDIRLSKVITENTSLEEINNIMI